MTLDDRRQPLRFLVHDRDAKFGDRLWLFAGYPRTQLASFIRSASTNRQSPGHDPRRSRRECSHAAAIVVSGEYGTCRFAGSLKRMMGLEPTTFCMASARERSRAFAPVRSNRLLAAVSVQRANSTEPERTPNLAILATESGALACPPSRVRCL
jgi:hypothetical protein